MRMMMKVKMDAAAASKAIQDGRMPQVMQATMELLKPEAAYFGPDGGQRTAFIVFQMDDPSQLPAISEPLFREFNATIDIFPVMDGEDLQRGLSTLASKS